jgi:Uma2 family endonuclease
MVSNLAAEYPLLTADDLVGLPATEDRVELVAGRVERMAPAGFEHGLIAAAVAHALRSFVLERGLGAVVSAETGFLLKRDPDTVRAPDVGFVAVERLATGGRPVGFFAGAPDLAFEVVSPTDTAEAVDAKVLDYLDTGSRQVWILSPRRRTLRVVESRERSRILGPDDTLSGGDLLPGFAVHVGDLFPD